MNQLDDKQNKDTAKSVINNKGSQGWIRKISKEIIAGSFWIYILVKLFLFDIDVFLVNKFAPDYGWLLKLKFFILIGIITLLWLFLKNKKILSWFAYIIFYPAIVFFWKIPYFVFKQKSWTLAFIFINAIISFFISLKYNFIISSIFLIAVASVFTFSNKILLWCAVLTILTILTLVNIHRFILVFRPSTIFQIHIKIFSGIRKHGTPSFSLDESIRELPIEKLDQKQIEKRTTNLQMAVLFNRICLFASKKLREYQNSGLNFISYVLTFFLLTISTITSFALINYGLYTINNGYFESAANPSFFLFFYYSFNTLLFNSIAELKPVMSISQIAFMIESVFALFLIVIFISLLMSVKSQRYAEELNKVIEQIDEQGKSMEGFISSEYKLNNVEAAMAELQKLKAGLIDFIYRISKNIG